MCKKAQKSVDIFLRVCENLASGCYCYGGSALGVRTGADRRNRNQNLSFSQIHMNVGSMGQAVIESPRLLFWQGSIAYHREGSK